MPPYRDLDPTAARKPDSAAIAAGALASSTASRGDFSAPDYKSPQYRTMEAVWELCGDMKAGTDAMRLKGERYLPRMQSEKRKDYAARVNMTFASDHYSTTLADLVGLPFSAPPVYGEDIPEKVRDLFENIDGRGTHMDVFLRQCFDDQLDQGHVVLMADYPHVPDPSRLSLQDVKDKKLRPYASRICAQDVLSWLTETIGGEEIVTQVVIRERGTVRKGVYGVESEDRFRVLIHDVRYEPNEYTGEDEAVELLGMRWELWRPARAGETKRNSAPKFFQIAAGMIEGPERLPISVAYADQLGTLYSRPFLAALAWVQLEEWQVQSEYANIMHKCNVPTPVFMGRKKDPTKPQESQITMGEGIDLPENGDAMMLEPTGVALGATRTRIQDLKQEARRHGASISNEVVGKLTATEVALINRQRNARLTGCVRSLNDAAEGLLANLAAFLGVKQQESDVSKAEDTTPTDIATARSATKPRRKAKGGGSVTISTDFAGEGFDVGFVTECRNAYMAGALPLDAYLHVLKTGELPDDFDPGATAELMALAAQAAKDAEEEAMKEAAAAGANVDDTTGASGDGEQQPPPTSGKAAAGKGGKGKAKRGKNRTPGDAAATRAAAKSAGT